MSLSCNISDVQTELDIKFGEFSDQAFAILLQDPDELKTMKMAENFINQERKRHKQKKIVMI